MYGYLEILSALIRIGPEAHEFPDPYEVAITLSANKGFAVLKGLTVPKDRLIYPDGTIKLVNRYSFAEARRIREVADEVCKEHGLTVIFDRIKKKKEE